MRILVIKLSAIGDVVMTLPAVAALRRSFPAAKISWVVERKAKSILEGSPLIDELIELDTARWRKQPLSWQTRQAVRQMLAQLRATPIDLALDFQGLWKSALVARLSKARRRIGFATAELREPASRFLLTEQIGPAEGGHVIEKNLRLVAAVGAETNGPYEFPLAIPPEDLAFIERQLAEHQIESFAILNPGGGWPTKLWAPERYGALADWLWHSYGLPSLITYGPGEEQLAASVARAAQTGHAVPLQTSLKQFVALTQKAEVFVSGDTGPMHLAAAVRAPIVGLFGPTAPERNGPFAPQDQVLGRDVPCRVNCYRRSCAHWICMDIPLVQVQQAVSQRLENRSEQN